MLLECFSLYKAQMTTMKTPATFSTLAYIAVHLFISSCLSLIHFTNHLSFPEGKFALTQRYKQSLILSIPAIKHELQKDCLTAFVRVCPAKTRLSSSGASELHHLMKFRRRVVKRLSSPLPSPSTSKRLRMTFSSSKTA